MPFKCLLRADRRDAERSRGAARAPAAGRSWIGAESGSQRILDAMEKGTRVEQIATATRAAARRRHRGRLLPAVRLSRRDAATTSSDAADGARLPRPTTSASRCRIRCRARRSTSACKAQLGEKQNWVDSDDLAMMYHATYVARVLPRAARARARRVPRAQLERRRARRARRGRCGRAMRARRQRAYHGVLGALLHRRLSRLARLTAPAPPTPLIPLLTPHAAAVPIRSASLKSAHGSGRCPTRAAVTHDVVARHGDAARAARRGDEPDVRPAAADVLSDQPLQQPLRVVRLVEAQRRRRSDARRDRRAGAERCRRSARAWWCSPAASRCCGRKYSTRRRCFRAHGMTLHLLTSGVLLERFAGPTSPQQFSRVIVSLDAPNEALYQDDPRRRRAAAVERGVARLRRLAPDVPVTARATLHRLNFRELPRLIDHARAMALDGISFLPADVSSSAFGRADAGGRRADGSALDRRDEIARVRRRSSSARSRATRDDFESGFIAESPEKLRRLPQYYAALGGDEPFPPRRRATRRGCRRWSRPTARSGPASSTSRSATSAQTPLDDDRHAQPAGVPADARRRREPGVRAVRLLAEDVGGGASPWQSTHALLDTQRAFDGVAADYDRSNAENPTLCATCAAHAREAVLTLRAARVARARSRLRSRHRRRVRWRSRLSRHRHRLVAGDGRRGAPRASRGAGLARPRRRACTLGIHELDALRAGAVRRRVLELRPAQLRRRSADARARSSRRRLRPGGVLIASVIGRVCPWEIALYLARGDWRRARDPLPRATGAGAARTGAPCGRGTTRRRRSNGSSDAPASRRVSLRALGLFVAAAVSARRLPAAIRALVARAAARRRRGRRAGRAARVGRSLSDRAEKAM